MKLWNLEKLRKEKDKVLITLSSSTLAYQYTGMQNLSDFLSDMVDLLPDIIPIVIVIGIIAVVVAFIGFMKGVFGKIRL